MRRLSSLGSRHLAHRKGRSALTASGIVLGVAILFGVLVSNATTETGVDNLIADFTGRADVLVTATGAIDATVPARRLQPLAGIDGVEVAAFSYNFRSAVRTPATGEPVQVSVRGIELATAERVQPYTLASGRMFEPGAREAVIPQRLADKLEVSPPARIGVSTPHGVQRVRLVGILDDTGAGRTNQGDAVFTALEDSRALARAGARYSGARVVLADDIDVEAWIDEHERDLGRGFDFENAETLAQGFQDFLAILGSIFTFFATITLFVGAFLIYLTLSVVVIERTRTYGTMRALGSTRAQIRRVVIAEAVALGVVSTAAGLLVGLLIAKGLLALMSGLFEIDLPGLTVTPGAVVTGVVVGVVTTLISSLVPARRAARLSPVVAMRGDHAAETRLGRGWAFGAVAAVAGIALGFSASGGLAAAATPLILLGAVLLTPLLLRPLAALLGRVTGRLSQGVGDVAVLHLRKERSRSAYTLALVMVVMAMIFAIGGLNATMTVAMEDFIDRQFGADFTIDAPGPLGEEFSTALKRVDGVGDVTGIRYAAIFTESEEGPVDEQSFARIIDPETYFDVESFAWVDGTDRAARRALGEGGAVLLPETTTAGLDKEVGDRFRVRTSRGVRRFTVAGTYASFAGPPEVIFGLRDGVRFLNAGDPSDFHVNVTRGTDVAVVKERLEAALVDRFNVEVTTAVSLKEEVRSEFNQFFTIFYAIIGVAAVVGLLGLANTLAMSVLQRVREIGVLRAIGTTRSQVRRMVLVESSTLGLVAFALSLPLGWLLSVQTVRGIESSFGFDMVYVYPSGWIPTVAAFGILVAVIAAIAPGRRAARLEVVEALAYE